MTAYGRLVVLTSSDSEELTAPLTQSLAGWCGAGLLGEVVWLTVSELEAQGYSASCWHNDAGEWTQSTLGAAMSRRHREEVWLAALRHPRGPGGSTSKAQARRTEEQAHTALRTLLGSGITFRSLTVQVADASVSSGFADCSPIWDSHLIHDSDVEAHESLPRVKAADRAPLSLCAMVALCASGGWSGSSRSLEIEPDRFDGPYKPARYVHCQMRVLHAPPVPLSATPTSPPWPLPETAGVERAQPDAVPPLTMADYLARQSGFVCRRPPLTRESSHRFDPFRLVRSLLHTVAEPVAETASEKAMGRLADRTGGFAEELEDITRLRLDGTAELPSLVHHIERSNFLDFGVSHTLAENPDAWRTARETMFGLVDGGPLPSGVAHPTRESKGDAKRLVWTDPKGVAPLYAPADAADIVSEPEPKLEKALPVQELVEESETNEETESDESETNESDSDDETGATGEAETTERVPPVERIVVEPRDTLMERLADAIHRGLREAQRGFRLNCALVSVKTAYDNALKAQDKARLRLIPLLLALIVITAFAIDLRWPYLADTWEFFTPFATARNNESVVPPIGWFIISAVVLTGGLALLWTPVRHMVKQLRHLERINAERDRLGAHSSHFASEFLRLYGNAQQFCDHRLIITEFLHRPFGELLEAETTTLSAKDLAFELPPPHSMLVAYAEVVPPKLDALRRRNQESAVEPGWLTDAYQRVYSLWSDRYRSRFVGDFEGPDHDIAARYSVIHRDRHDGSDIFGARTDFAHGVVSDPQAEGSGWAIRQATANQVVSYQDSDELADDYLELFDSIESVHGLQPGIDATTFFRFASRPHRFDWDDLLSAGAHGPAEKSQLLQTRRYVLPNASEGRSLVVAWRLELSGAVRPQNQAGWRNTDSDDQPTETSRSVV